MASSAASHPLPLHPPTLSAPAPGASKNMSPAHTPYLINHSLARQITYQVIDGTVRAALHLSSSPPHFALPSWS
ncbi:hypothetical protein NP233_g3754 [Leucocoprinus birnbaumii]|uniref:Uncharacterized protein n=1 Tax=Leucocoprinus birnbaumii TaxID=56174 RepID=A0AAD5VYL6_9AGAR|nr:hypothetical protein NP233_g3754 [Leucocoprinus birnbaumii]